MNRRTRKPSSYVCQNCTRNPRGTCVTVIQAHRANIPSVIAQVGLVRRIELKCWGCGNSHRKRLKSKNCARLDPHQLTELQKTLLSHLQPYHVKENAFPFSIGTGEESWCHNFQSESKQQWKTMGFCTTKKV